MENLLGAKQRPGVIFGHWSSSKLFPREYISSVRGWKEILSTLYSLDVEPILLLIDMTPKNLFKIISSVYTYSRASYYCETLIHQSWKLTLTLGPGLD